MRAGAKPVLLYDMIAGGVLQGRPSSSTDSRHWVRDCWPVVSEGLRVKSEFFGPGDQPDAMFWLLVGDKGFGGRCGILPLAREIERKGPLTKSDGDACPRAKSAANSRSPSKGQNYQEKKRRLA